MAHLTVEHETPQANEPLTAQTSKQTNTEAFREPTSRAASTMPLHKKTEGHPGVTIALTYDFL